MSKELLARLNTVHVNFGIGLRGLAALSDLTPEQLQSRPKPVIKPDGLYFSGAAYQAKDGEYIVGAKLPDRERLKWAIMEASKMLLRNLTLDGYESVYNYCDETGQLAQLQSQDWYQFYRLIRHCLTHTQKWKFPDRVKKTLPVTWQGRTINASDEGTEPPFEFFDWYVGLELFNEMRDFASTLR